MALEPANYCRLLHRELIEPSGFTVGNISNTSNTNFVTWGKTDYIECLYWAYKLSWVLIKQGRMISRPVSRRIFLVLLRCANAIKV